MKLAAISLPVKQHGHRQTTTFSLDEDLQTIICFIER